MPHLTVLNGSIRGKIVVLGSEPCRIGRDAAIELPINDAKASRIHVEITNKDGQFVMRDLKSKNGTLVNGTSVSALTLKEGDQIQIGETRLAFSMQDAPKHHAKEARNFDSVLAARLPVGAMPALGSAGMSDRGAESFETLELNAPLSILSVDSTPAAASPIADNARALERANKSLRALYTIAGAAAEVKSSMELWSALSEGLRNALEADRVTPVMLHEKGHWDVVTIPVVESPDKPKVREPKINFSKVPVSRTIVDYALRTGRSVLTAPGSDARFDGAKSVGEQGISSALCVPIVAPAQGGEQGGRVLGLIYADRMGGQDFTREDQELLTAACLQAAPALANLCRLEELLAKKERLVRELKEQHNLLGESDRMRDVSAFIERAAPTQSVVLVLGESGTGKELVARAIHYKSKRSDGPMVVVNCAALSESLIESELFGHSKGAFTGATADRAGRFEMAHEGTIFLDEIGELSNTCQTKLLRVLEQGELSRVGEGRVRKVDVRVLAATNRDLPVEVKTGRFREDLFYRLNVLSISLPPLRERGNDIKLLLGHYLHEAAVRTGRRTLEFSEEAIDMLQRYRWPGNVRELRNLTERLAVLCPAEIIGISELPAECRLPDLDFTRAETIDARAPTPQAFTQALQSGTGKSDRSLAEVEREHILAVLEGCDNNKKLASEKLGIDRSTLYTKLRAYGILS